MGITKRNTSARSGGWSHVAWRPVDKRARANQMKHRTAFIQEPLFILAPPRSFGSLFGTMLGQHPHLYGLPETHLFGCQTIGEWLDRSANASFGMADGLLRAIAELFFGEQNEINITRAAAWLQRRADFTTAFILETIAERVYPRMLVERSPSIVYTQTSLCRAYTMFPMARFIHLLQHPRGYCELVMKGIDDAAANGPVPGWMLDLASYHSRPIGDSDSSYNPDPQHAWYALNMNICEFLASVPNTQKMKVRGEELLMDPDVCLAAIANWIGIGMDATALEAMRHPESSPYASLGPPSARYGSDHNFLENPTQQLISPRFYTLAGVLPWRQDGGEFLPEVATLAQRFGYI